MKDALLFNKIAAAVVAAALLAMVAGALSRILYTDHTPEEPAYVIATGESASGDTGAEEPEEPAGPAPVAGMLADADVARGEKLFRKCSACHNAEKGAGAKVGPNLWNIVNSAKAGSDDFGGYSSAMKDFGGDWSYEELNQFLYKPKDYISGTAMSFSGFKKDSDRANIIAYLRTLSDNPAPLP